MTLDRRRLPLRLLPHPPTTTHTTYLPPLLPTTPPHLPTLHVPPALMIQVDALLRTNRYRFTPHARATPRTPRPAGSVMVTTLLPTCYGELLDYCGYSTAICCWRRCAAFAYRICYHAPAHIALLRCRNKGGISIGLHYKAFCWLLDYQPIEQLTVRAVCPPHPPSTFRCYLDGPGVPQCPPYLPTPPAPTCQPHPTAPPPRPTPRGRFAGALRVGVDCAIDTDACREDENRLLPARTLPRW